MLPIKNNLGPRKDGLSFRINQRIVAGNIVAPHLDWDHEPVTVTANEVLAAESERTSGDRSALTRRWISFAPNYCEARSRRPWSKNKPEKPVSRSQLLGERVMN